MVNLSRAMKHAKGAAVLCVISAYEYACADTECQSSAGTRFLQEFVEIFVLTGHVCKHPKWEYPLGSDFLLTCKSGYLSF